MYRRIALIIEPGVFGIVSAFNLAGCGHRHHDRDLNICRAGSRRNRSYLLGVGSPKQVRLCSEFRVERRLDVYVTNAGSNSVWMYNIDASTGTLTLIGTIGTWRGAGSSGRALFDVFHFGGPHNLIPTQKAVSRRKPVGKRL